MVVDGQGSLLYSNARARTFLALGHEATPSRLGELGAWLPPSEQALWSEQLKRARSGQEARFDLRRGTPGQNGEAIFQIEMQGLPAADSAAPRVLILIENATRRRRYEQDLVQMHDALQEAMRTRDTIFSILGHDLRSPIAQLNALLFFLRKAPEQLSEQRIADYIRHLEDSTRHLSQALDNLLHWSSTHRDSMQPQFEVVDLTLLAKEATGLLRLDADRKQIRLILDAQPGIEILTDKGFLAYIMRNLLANAVKFSPAGSSVRLQQELTEAGSYRLRVIDQGMGMAPAHLDAVRDRDRLVSTPGTEGEKGLGLGLPLCSEFSQLLKGTLSIESREGEGTTVTLELPPICEHEN